jgi:hypothetical protein
MKKGQTRSSYEALERNGGSGDAAFKGYGHTIQHRCRRCLRVGSWKYGTVTTLQKQFNFAQWHLRGEESWVWMVVNPGIEVN